MALSFFASARIPVLLMTCPRNVTQLCENWHFSMFSVSPASWSRWRTLLRCSSCSSWVLPWTRISSTMHTTPLTPSRISDIRRWKCSGAMVIPKGSRWKQNLPHGVMKVVSRADSGARGICQNPELASSLVNTLAPPSWARVGSTAGSGCFSLHTLWFGWVRSTQILTLLFALGTTTMPAHQAVGSLTFAMTPSAFIRRSSCSTAFLSGIATLRGVDSTYGLASGSNLML